MVVQPLAVGAVVFFPDDGTRAIGGQHRAAGDVVVEIGDRWLGYIGHHHGVGIGRPGADTGRGGGAHLADVRRAIGQARHVDG